MNTRFNKSCSLFSYWKSPWNNQTKKRKRFKHLHLSEGVHYFNNKDRSYQILIKAALYYIQKTLCIQGTHPKGIVSQSKTLVKIQNAWVERTTERKLSRTSGRGTLKVSSDSTATTPKDQQITNGATTPLSRAEKAAPKAPTAAKSWRVWTLTTKTTSRNSNRSSSLDVS